MATKKQKAHPPQVLPESRVNFIRGKASVGHATPNELREIFEHLDAIELWLDEKDGEDFFGTEGWRHSLGVPDCD